MKLLFDLLVFRGSNVEKDRRNIAWYNIIMLSISMLLLYSTLRTLINGMKVIVSEMHIADPTLNVNTDFILGYSTLLSSFTSFFSCWIVIKTETRIWLIIFAFCIILLVGQFYLSFAKYIIYIVCAITGIILSISNAARIHYIKLNSFYSTNIDKNSEIFWSIALTSMCLPNYFLWLVITDSNESNMPFSEYKIVCTFLLTTAILGFIITLFLGSPVTKYTEIFYSPWLLTLKALELLLTKDIFIMVITFVYNGLQDTFMSGVYGNVIGFTNCFTDSQHRMRNAFLSGLITAIGTTTGVISYLLLRTKLKIRWHFKVFTLGALLHLISYILILLNIPNDAVLRPTNNQSLYMCNFNVALFCSFLQGLGNYYIRTKVYDLLLDISESQLRTSVFLENFVTNIFAAVAYFYNSSQMFAVVGMLLFTLLSSFIAFYVVEIRAKSREMDALDDPRQVYSKY